ncbi:MAG: hypothetical protein ABI192_07490 [Bradyrhizobium sp.]
MTNNLNKRFDRWRGRLPIRTAKLVQKVVDELVPLYERAGLQRYEDYAGGDLRSVGSNCIPLQRREGPNWPTVEIQFDRRRRPNFNIVFAELPETCTRRSVSSITKISRLEANVVEGDASFVLCKGSKKNFDCTFGITGITLFRDSKINHDLSLALSRSKNLVELFGTGLPPQWLGAPPGYVDEFFFKLPIKKH